jgi:hypothetical protein
LPWKADDRRYAVAGNSEKSIPEKFARVMRSQIKAARLIAQMANNGEKLEAAGGGVPFVGA